MDYYELHKMPCVESVENAGLIAGDVSIPDRQKIIDVFQKNENVNVLLCQIISGGTKIRKPQPLSFSPNRKSNHR